MSNMSDSWAALSSRIPQSLVGGRWHACKAYQSDGIDPVSLPEQPRLVVRGAVRGGMGLARQALLAVEVEVA